MAPTASFRGSDCGDRGHLARPLSIRPGHTFLVDRLPRDDDDRGQPAHLRAEGYEPMEHFVLPPEDWSDYYVPLEKELQKLEREPEPDPVTQKLVSDLQREIDLWRDEGSRHGYVFYLARRP